MAAVGLKFSIAGNKPRIIVPCQWGCLLFLREKIVMTDEEFSQLLKSLHRIGLKDGDIGYSYWASVIKNLQEMRAVYLAHTPAPTPDNGN